MATDANTPTHRLILRRYLVAVAHLDEQPENFDAPPGRLRQRTDLRALCTVCHLRFDSRFRAMQKRLKAEFFGHLRIADAWQEGSQPSLWPTHIAPFSIPYRGKAPTEGGQFQWAKRVKLQSVETNSCVFIE